MFRPGRAVVVALSIGLASQFGARAALAQEAPEAAKAAAPQAAPVLQAPPPKVIGASDTGISSGATSGAPTEAPVTFYPDRYPPPEVRWKTLGLGVGLVAVGYGLAVGTSYLWDGAPGMSSLRTPVVGPFGAIADSRCGEAEGIDCSTMTVVLRAVLAGVSGLAQIGGLGVLTEGVLMKTQDQPLTAARGPKWYALPTASKSGAGVHVGMTF